MFGLKYSGEFFSQYENIHWRVEIAQRGYDGSAENLKFVIDSNPLTLTWEKQGDEFYIPIKASEATITINCDTNFQYLDLFTSDPRFFRVSIYRDTKLYWRGFLVSDLYSEQFSPPPYNVELKAVDGFNLLNSMPFVDTYGREFKDPKLSLWQIIEKCYELLELDLDIADWSNIFSIGMDQTKSPLNQIFIKPQEFYNVNKEATYRDALELAVSPFMYQVFQSNGALHIRSVKSLYDTYRPLAYYNTSERGELVTHNGDVIATHLDAPLITNIVRKRLESMWEDFYVQNTATLEIVPAIKDITITSNNRCVKDIAAKIGAFNIEQWKVNSGFTIKIENSKIYIDEIFNQPENNLRAEFTSDLIESINLPVELKFTLNWLDDYTDNDTITANVKILLCYYNDVKKLYYNGTEWIESESEDSLYRMVEIIQAGQNTLTYNMPDLPIDGRISIKYVNKLGHPLPTYFTINLTLDDQHSTLIEDSLIIKHIVNISNNTTYELSVPLLDLPSLPNNDMVYELTYINDADVSPKFWVKAGGKSYQTLASMIIETSTKLRGFPAKKISGEMHTKKLVDMNTVLIDDKFLNTGFYINAFSLDAYNDNFNCEFVEMPGLMTIDKQGVILSHLNVSRAITFESNIIYANKNELHIYITSVARNMLISKFKNIVGIYGGVNHCYAICDDQVLVIDYRGQVINKYRAFLPANVFPGQTEELPFIRIDHYGSDQPIGVVKYKFLNHDYMGYDFINEKTYGAYDIAGPIKYARNLIAVNERSQPFVTNTNLGVNDYFFTEQPILDIGERYIITTESRTALTQVAVCRNFKFLKIDPNILFEIDSKYTIYAVSNYLIAVSDGKQVKLFYEDTMSFSDLGIDRTCGNVQLMTISSNYIYIVCTSAILRYSI